MARNDGRPRAPDIAHERDDMLQKWFDRRHNEWPGVTLRILVRRVDALYCTWWDGHPDAPDIFTRTALAAFWPDDATANEH